MLREKQTQERPIIDLDGPEGNAFWLLGAANKYSKQLK